MKCPSCGAPVEPCGHESRVVGGLGRRCVNGDEILDWCEGHRYIEPPKPPEQAEA